MAQFDNIHKLVGVPVITVQLRYNGWVTEMSSADQQPQHSQQQARLQGMPPSSAAVGLDNLLYRCAAIMFSCIFSCFHTSRLWGCVLKCLRS
jgi:zeta-carotene desaturase